MWVFDVESLAFLDVNDATMATYALVPRRVPPA